MASTFDESSASQPWWYSLAVTWGPLAVVAMGMAWTIWIMVTRIGDGIDRENERLTKVETIPQQRQLFFNEIVAELKVSQTNQHTMQALLVQLESHDTMEKQRLEDIFQHCLGRKPSDPRRER
jgi:hypothetical protein